MKKLLSITKLSDGFLKEYRLRYDTGDGRTYDWDMVSPREIKDASDLHHGPTAVEMVARFENGDFLLQREFRYPVDRMCYSFPCGIIDPGESVEEAIRRELYEETGVRLVSIDRLLPPGIFASGLSDEVMQVAHVTVEGELGGHPEYMEEIHPCRMTPDEVRAMLKEDDLSISLSCLLVLDTLLNGG